MRVPYERLSLGQHLEVLVMNVVNPWDISVQLYGTKVVDLMERIGCVPF